MNKLKFLQAMSQIDDDLIKEAEIDIDKADDMTGSVSGVEIYRGIKWQRYAAIASAFLLITGLGAAGGLFLWHHGAPTSDDDNIVTEAVPTTESNALAELEETTASRSTSASREAKQPPQTATTAAAVTTAQTEKTASTKQTSTATQTAVKSAASTAPATIQKSADTTPKPVSVQTTASTTVKAPTTTAPVTTVTAPVQKSGKLTLADVIELSKKGDDLTWDDFKGYEYEDIGSGLYIYRYYIDEGGGYSLLIGGVPPQKPYYIKLVEGKVSMNTQIYGDSIDIRTENVADFINSRRGESKTEDEQNKYSTEYSSTAEQLCRDFKKGCYDWDFNFDGKTDLTDVSCINWYYSEIATVKMDVWYDNYTNNGESVSKEYYPTDEWRQKIAKHGDINKDGVVNTQDSTLMQQVLFRSYEAGDFNTDGVIDARDASDILKYYCAKSTNAQISYEFEVKAKYLGDVTYDKIVDARDASEILVIYSENATS